MKILLVTIAVTKVDLLSLVKQARGLLPTLYLDILRDKVISIMCKFLQYFYRLISFNEIYSHLPLHNSGLNQDAAPNANAENSRELTFNLIRADLQSIQLQISCLCQSLKVVEERLQAALKNEH